MPDAPTTAPDPRAPNQERKIRVQCEINGRAMTLETYPMARLLDVLREQAGLTRIGLQATRLGNGSDHLAVQPPRTMDDQRAQREADQRPFGAVGTRDIHDPRPAGGEQHFTGTDG